MNVDIEIEDPRWNGIVGLRALATRAVRNSVPRGEKRTVAILFTCDAEMRTINRDWRKKDTPTNVLSFPAAPTQVPRGESAPLGDLVLAYETIAAEAKDARKPLNDYLSHLIVHGMLHLLGYDHQTDSEAEQMESRESRILARIGVANPYVS